jgi:hypothetical protein
MSNKFYLIILLTILTTAAQSQIDTSIKIDVLRASASPASNLLGIASSDIEKPTAVNDIMLSIRNASKNFTVIPKSYAIDIAPFALWGKKYLDTKYINDRKNTFKQSFIISAGVNTLEKNDSVANSVNKTQLGIGIKFSIVRGNVDARSKNAIENIYNLQEKSIISFLDLSNNDKILKELKDSATQIDIDASKTSDSTYNTFLKIKKELNTLEQTKRLRELKKLETEENSTKSRNEKIKTEAAKIKFERTGFNLDFAAGTVIDFLENKFNNSRIYKTGAWLTGSYSDSSKGGSTVLTIIRYLYNPKTSFVDPTLQLENLHTLDGGIRLIITALEKKLSLSSEAIYRSILNKASAKSSWRLLFNAEYEIGINQKLTFSFGRDFDGQIYKGGNLISAVNFLIGFGKQTIPKKAAVANN